MLTLHDVSVRYGRFTALDGVTWEVGTGESTVTALLGPSGCGKSTLLRAIAGLEPLARGTVSWDGVDVSATPPHRRDFGVVFQDGQLFPGRTVAQNVAYGLARRGIAGRAAADRVAEMLRLVHLPDFGARPVAELSGGQAQRVALARALAPEPRLLLLDEPLAAVDAQLRESLAEAIGEVVRHTGTPTVIVTHDHREAALLADTVSVMRAGAIVQTDEAFRIWHRPADDETARFLGARAVVDGTLSAGVLTTAVGRADLTDLAFADVVDGDVRVALRPEAVVAVADDAGSGRTGVVEQAAAMVAGWRLRVRLESEVLDAVSAVRMEPGAPVSVRLDPGALAIVG